VAFLGTGDLAALVRVSLEERAAFFLDALSTNWNFLRDSTPCQVPGAMPERIHECARSLALEHESPEVRAIALSFALRPVGQRGPDLALLRDAFDRDPDPLVTRAALRIAGFFGDAPGNLNLRRIIFEEESPTSSSTRSRRATSGARPPRHPERT